HRVSTRRHILQDVRMPECVLPDDEKGRLCAMRVERIQNGPCRLRPRSVVESQNNLFGQEEIVDPVLLEPETRPAGRIDLHRAGYSEGVGLPWTACMGSRPRQYGREGQSDCCNAHIIPRSRSLLGVTSCSRSHYKRRGAKLASLEGAYRCTKTYQGASVPVHQFKSDFRVTSNAANWSAIGSLAASWFARGSEKDA